MLALRQSDLWRQGASSRAFTLFLAAVALSLVRARDQPHVDLSVAGTTVSIVPGDLVLAALAVTALAVLARGRRWEAARWPLLTAGAFCAYLLATAAINGATALVAGVKLVELAALGLGAIAFVRTRAQVEALVDLLLLFTLVADVVGIVGYISQGGRRQAAFLGEHDFAALATMPLVYGLALAFEGGRGRRAALAIVAGCVGVSLGASLATLLGVYLGAAALLLVAAVRGSWRLRPVLVVIATVAALTGATFFLRSGELGFLKQWFGPPPSQPGEYAASWSQRLIFAYVGGRVFLDRPVLGTGWWGQLPPSEFREYLPDARARFSDQPPRYFPKADEAFIPQQVYDQILYELGLVGAALFAAFLATLVARSVAAARAAPGALAMLPAVWLAAAAGAIAGEGFFGGTALAALFWLSAGLVVTIPLARA